ncbi:uncharacterized protein TRIADDRAFT_52070 [Trichoplax adhaerens]|uniref:Ig-like domain-containing protein n=1 Tax=Trichoplax adhaerens TaxID=10228 RepID=B3RLN9_TRIAD|nr:hypothetical protein TRIADDRAFT_52070 [Trichoplax adhaerens]EDV29559.1 hypothetical protein TRIADDRAFT_52070 [Trichoplax adhaerens]|eukprot:XP_002108761.1 hypothetical protein TRIADDRAFT_52070 [Trichoplax adhaerens]
MESLSCLSMFYSICIYVVIVILSIIQAGNSALANEYNCSVIGVKAFCQNLALRSVPDYLSQETEQLYLQFNSIDNLKEDQFSKFKRLEYLDLSFNKLKGFPRNVFKLPSLKQLLLQGNPVNCSCSLNWTNGDANRLSLADNAVCAVPSQYSHLKLRDLTKEKIKCDVAPRINTNCKSRLKGEENTLFNISCCAHGYPSPNVVIYDNEGRVLSNQTDQVVWIGLLTYENRNKQYTCIAKNHMGEISQNFTLETMYGPKFMNDNFLNQVVLYQGHNISYRINCQAQANPNQVVYTWSIEKNNINEVINYQQSIYELNNITADKSGIYFCKVCQGIKCQLRYTNITIHEPSVSISFDENTEGINCSTTSCDILQKSTVKATCFIHYNQVIISEQTTGVNFNWILRNENINFQGCNNTCTNCNCSMANNHNQAEFYISNINIDQNAVMRCEVNFKSPHLPSSFDSVVELKVIPILIPSLQVLPINIERGQKSVTMTCKPLYSMDIYNFNNYIPLPISIAWFTGTSQELLDDDNININTDLQGLESNLIIKDIERLELGTNSVNGVVKINIKCTGTNSAGDSNADSFITIRESNVTFCPGDISDGIQWSITPAEYTDTKDCAVGLTGYLYVA